MPVLQRPVELTVDSRQSQSMTLAQKNSQNSPRQVLKIQGREKTEKVSPNVDHQKKKEPETRFAGHRVQIHYSGQAATLPIMADLSPKSFTRPGLS